MMIMAANCSRTRQRIRFWERLAEPPRIMFHRPRSKTTATAATASGHEIVENIHGAETLLPFVISCGDNGVLERTPS